MYIPIIGLEIHIQLKTKSKMFCGCDNRGEDQEPNTTICPVCLGYPGVLPVINQEAVEKTILMGLALNGRVSEFSKFDRKNYFYPDLPKGYQISQFDKPLIEGGWIEIKNQKSKVKSNKEEIRKIRITRIHLEEDAAKLIHSGEGEYSLIDFNRSDTPLLEIVTEPDLRSPQEAKIFLQELRLIARYLGVSDADMERGHLRCDANISLSRISTNKSQISTNDSKKLEAKFEEISDEEISNDKDLNPKTEIKNLNSFKAVERALEYEIKRQTRLWEEGNPPKKQATRGWDEARGKTVEQRVKEESHDYRYFPEPDLPPIRFQISDIRYQISDIRYQSLGIELDRVRQRMRELPQAKRQRFTEQYGFNLEEAKILTEDRELSYYVEKVISELKAWLLSLEEVEGSEEEIWQRNKKKLVKMVGNWLINKLGALTAKQGIEIKDLKITPENFAEFITLIYQNKISSTLGQKILEKMLETGADPSHIVAEENLEQVSDERELETIIDEVIKTNPQVIIDYQKGKTNALQFLVGQVMKRSKGKANPGKVNEMLGKKLKKI